MFAIVEIAGKQFKVAQGDTVTVPRLKTAKEGDKIKADRVLLTAKDGKATLGAPVVKGASVEMTVKGHLKGEKIRVFKRQPKKRYERTRGHRQAYTNVEITAVK